MLGIKNKSPSWITRCSNEKFASSLSVMNMRIDGFGMAQVGDELWCCGGTSPNQDAGYDDAQSCTILNLVNGTWSTLEAKMNFPRHEPIVYEDNGKVVVMGGH